MKRGLVFILITVVLLVVLVSGCTNQQPGEKNEKTVNIVQANPPDMARKLAAGEIDAFIAWEPFNAQAVLAGQGKYLQQSGDIWKNHPCCVLAAVENLNDPAVLQALVWSHIKATNFMNDPANRDKLLKYAQEFTGQDQATVIEALSHIKYTGYPDQEQLKVYYQRLKSSGILNKSFTDIGYQREEQFFRDFLNKGVYEQVQTNLTRDPGWKPEPVPAGISIRMGYLNRDLHELAVYIAQKEGYYDAVGLVPGKNLVIKEYANGVAVMEAFKAKELDASYLGGAPATMKRINDNIKIRVIGGANDEGSAIVVGKNSTVSSVKDLQGKTVAVPAVGTVQYFVVDKMLRDAGLKPVMK